MGSLQVFGPRALYEFSVPSPGELFSETNFTIVPPEGGWLGSQAKPLRQADLYVLMEPEKYSREFISRLPRPLWLWSLERLVTGEEDDLERTPALARQAVSRIEKVRAALTSIPVKDYDLLIVPDLGAQKYLSSVGHRCILSPPAVNESLFGLANNGGEESVFATFNTESDYRNLYTQGLEVSVQQLGVETIVPEGIRSVLSGVTHGINLGQTAVRDFPLEAALHLAMGHTLISEPLDPKHGLEPGIDYFEVTSVPELFHVTNYVGRNPGTTKLMAYRGSQKAKYFGADRVFSDLLRQA